MICDGWWQGSNRQKTLGGVGCTTDASVLKALFMSQGWHPPFLWGMVRGGVRSWARR